MLVSTGPSNEMPVTLLSSTGNKAKMQTLKQAIERRLQKQFVARSNCA
jgi:hypothetical protein